MDQNERPDGPHAPSLRARADAGDAATLRAAMAAFAFGALSQTGCVISSPETRVVVRDPDAVSVSSGWSSPDEAQLVALPAAATPADAALARGSFRTTNGSSATYEAHAVREEDHTIALRWGDVVMPTGNRMEIVRADGRIDVRGLDSKDVMAGEGLGRADVRLRSSAWLTPLADDDGNPLGFGAQVGLAEKPSDAVVTVPFTLATQWSNIVEIRRRTRPARGAAFIIAALATGVLGGAGVPLAISSSKPLKIAGYGLVGTGAMVDLLLLPTIFAAGQDEVVYGSPAGAGGGHRDGKR